MAQDTAFGPELDLERWLATLDFPLTLVSASGESVYASAEEAGPLLRKSVELAHEDGIVKLRTRVLSAVEVGADMAIVSTYRDRLTARGPIEGVLGTTPITWTLRRTPEGWRIFRIFFDGLPYEESRRSSTGTDGGAPAPDRKE